MTINKKIYTAKTPSGRATLSQTDGEGLTQGPGCKETNTSDVFSCGPKSADLMTFYNLNVIS